MLQPRWPRRANLRFMASRYDRNVLLPQKPRGLVLPHSVATHMVLGKRHSERRAAADEHRKLEPG
jgi:hypothetical protein